MSLIWSLISSTLLHIRHLDGHLVVSVLVVVDAPAGGPFIHRLEVIQPHVNRPIRFTLGLGQHAGHLYRSVVLRISLPFWSHLM